jgi:hypothetical protein
MPFIADLKPSRLNRPWMTFELASATRTEDNPSGFAVPLLRNRWKWLMDYVRETYAAGFRVFALHRPFGEVTSEDTLMQYDSPVELRLRAGSDTTGNYSEAIALLDSFEEEFLDVFAQEFPDAELVIYVGALSTKRLQGFLRDSKVGEWADRLLSVVRACLDRPFVHFGFDYLNTYHPSTPEYKILDAMRAALEISGRHSFIEGISSSDLDHPEHIGWDGICLEPYWHDFIVSKHGLEKKPSHLDNGNLYVRWWTGHAERAGNFDGDYKAWSKNCYQTGTIPGINYSEWRDGPKEDFGTLDKWVAFMTGKEESASPDFPGIPLFDIEQSVEQPQKYGNTNTEVLQQAAYISENWAMSEKELQGSIENAMALSVYSVVLPVGDFGTPETISTAVQTIRSQMPGVRIVLLTDLVRPDLDGLADYISLSVGIETRLDFTRLIDWTTRVQNGLNKMQKASPSQPVFPSVRCHFRPQHLSWLPLMYQILPKDSLFMDTHRWTAICREMFEVSNIMGILYDSSHRAGARVSIKIAESQRVLAIS